MHKLGGPLVLALFGCAWACGCGYHTVYGESGEHLSVVLVRSLVADAVASDEVVSGLREALAREGALASGQGYPRVEVEVLRGDETSEGIAASSLALGGSQATPSASGALSQTGPRARGTEVGLLGRACLVRAKGGPCERDAGDMRVMDLAASDLEALTPGAPDVTSDAFHHRDILRSVGRRLGERLAMHILGQPTASDESIGREH